jgi:hypothetical protein
VQFATEWREYHKQRATLQILCRTCNNKKGWKGMTWGWHKSHGGDMGVTWGWQNEKL